MRQQQRVGVGGIRRRWPGPIPVHSFSSSPAAARSAPNSWQKVGSQVGLPWKPEPGSLGSCARAADPCPGSQCRAVRAAGVPRPKLRPSGQAGHRRTTSTVSELVSALLRVKHPVCFADPGQTAIVANHIAGWIQGEGYSVWLWCPFQKRGSP